mmetsp:Transcript_16616/g.34091  ORF Transcript_16616/g.34091 Transcript_16616/m.34091 type:complete len:238 (+) Transcript_16616:13-726(+)
MLSPASAAFVFVLGLSTCSAFVSTPLAFSARAISLRKASLSAASSRWTAQLGAVGAQSAKSELIDLVLSTSRFGTDLGEDGAQRVEGLIASLEGQSKGFDRATADGEWALIYEINAEGSPTLQKFSQNFESVGGSFANFDVSKNEFYNIAKLFGGNGELQATVEFGEVSNADSSRISCDIVDASLQLGPLPPLPLPLRAKGGWLDFLYLDQDLRITRGNRGGLFIHVRPDLLREKMQ